MPNGRVRISVARSRGEGAAVLGVEEGEGAISQELTDLLLDQINDDAFTLMPGEGVGIVVYLVGLPAATDGR